MNRGGSVEQKNTELRQVLLSFLTICLLLVSVTMNDSLLKDERMVYLVSDSPGANSTNVANVEKAARSFASASPASQHQTIEWEHDLVKKLNKDSFYSETSLVTGKMASVEDQLRYGVLAGKYRIEKRFGSSKLISRIEYIATNDVLDRPILLNREAFLVDFKDLFSVPFERFELVKTEKSEGKEVYRLLDSKKSTVGKVSFEMDIEGRLISMSFQ